MTSLTQIEETIGGGYLDPDSSRQDTNLFKNSRKGHIEKTVKQDGGSPLAMSLAKEAARVHQIIGEKDSRHIRDRGRVPAEQVVERSALWEECIFVHCLYSLAQVKKILKRWWASVLVL